MGENFAGFLLGTGLGTSVGALGGLLLPCEDCELSDRLAGAVLLGVLGAVLGGPVGVIGGAFTINLEIEGKYSNYEKFKNEMERKRLKRINRKTQS